MKIEEVNFDLSISEGPPRSEGSHVSHIIRNIALEVGFLDAKYKDDDTMDVDKMALGMAWEDWVCRQHPEILHQPGEMEVDGVYMTPDGVSFEDVQPVVHEFKLTWKSEKVPDEIKNEWMWLTQIKSYCKGWDTNLAKLHAYWINGNYKYGSKLVRRYRLYKLTFTRQEIDDNWKMLMKYKKDRLIHIPKRKVSFK